MGSASVPLPQLMWRCLQGGKEGKGFQQQERQGDARQRNEHKGDVKSGELRRAETRHKNTEARCCKLRRGAVSGGEVGQSSEARCMVG